MSLPHEQKAREKYPTARNFEAVHVTKALSFRPHMVGWVFEADKADSFTHYAWITVQHEITSDPQALRKDAEESLRSYVRNLRTIKEYADHGPVAQQQIMVDTTPPNNYLL
jgi:hypothetical protein